MPPKTQDCVKRGHGILEEPPNHLSSMHELLEKYSNHTKTFVPYPSSRNETRPRYEIWDMLQYLWSHWQVSWQRDVALLGSSLTRLTALVAWMVVWFFVSRTWIRSTASRHHHSASGLLRFKGLIGWLYLSHFWIGGFQNKVKIIWNVNNSTQILTRHEIHIAWMSQSHMLSQMRSSRYSKNRNYKQVPNTG